MGQSTTSACSSQCVIGCRPSPQRAANGWTMSLALASAQPCLYLSGRESSLSAPTVGSSLAHQHLCLAIDLLICWPEGSWIFLFHEK